MKKKFIKTPLKGVYVHGAKDVGTRTVNLLMGEHAGEYVRGDIMDANAVIQAFDELKGNVDNNHDSLEEIVNEIHNFRDTTNHRFDVFQEKAEEETANRIQGDNTLDEKIDQKETESNERDNVLQQNINTEKQERVNADTQLRNDLTAEVNRAKANENALSSDIHAEATKRENDDNTIKDNLNAEVTRATAKENEIKAEVDVINGDSTTEGSFRKAIADVVGAAPEAYDTLKEIADKLNSNDDLHTAINDAIATKATTVALNEEITRAKAAEAENKAEIAAEAARAKEVEGDNALAIQNEESRATTAETAINESLNTEIDRAKGQEAYLQNLVNAKADTTALDSAKAELDKKISDETTRATGVEATKASADDLAAEITRAKQAEAAITSDITEKLAQKADTTALNNYVLTTALDEQVDTLNAAIDTKQPKGNYLTEHQSLEEYAKKVELPTVPTKVSQLTNDSNFITSADVDLTPYATTEALTTVEQKVDANTTAITNVTVSKGIPYNPSVTNVYQTDKDLAVKLNDTNTATFGPNSCINLKSSDTNTARIDYGSMSLKTGPYTFSVNPGGIKQVGSYKFDVNSSDGIKWSTPDDVIYSKIGPNGLQTKVRDDAYTRCTNDTYIDIKHAYNQYVLLTPNIIKTLDNDRYFELNQNLGTMRCLLGTSDDSVGFKLSTYGLSIGKKSDINVDNGELISISREAGNNMHSITYSFKVKDNTIENNKIRIDQFGFTNDKDDTTYNSHPLYVRGETGAILVQNSADLSIGYASSINTNPFWKFGSYGAEFNGTDSKKRIDIHEGNYEYANIFGIKLSNNVFNQNSHINDPCEIENNRDYVSFSKKIKVSDIVTDATTDSSLNAVLSKKVDTGAFNNFASSVNGQFNSFNGALSNFGGQIASKQDKITPTAELDLTSIDTANIESLRSIVKALAIELNTLGLIRLKSAEETA